MSDENRKDDPGTDPEAQRQELIRRSKVAHPAGERSKMRNTTRADEDDEDDERDDEGRETSSELGNPPSILEKPLDVDRIRGDDAGRKKAG